MTADRVVNPATGEVLAEVPRTDSAGVHAAVASARAAFDEWRSVPPADRSAALWALADLVAADAADLAEMESRNAGKPIAATPEEIDFSVDNMRFLAGAARCLTGPAAGEYVAGATSMVRREPIGVVGAIAPWNYPLMMAVWKLAPAIAAGCPVVLKPSGLTPLTTLRLAELAGKALPPGVFTVVTGDGSVGAALAGHPDVDMVSVTGSVATGRSVATAAAATLKRLHLELGGNAPAVVLDDADVGAVATAVRTAGYGNAGQDCTAACRVIATAAVCDEVVQAVTAAAGSLVVGDPRDAATEIGPLISLAQRERVRGFVTRARNAGAVVTTGAGRSTAPVPSSSPR